MSTRLEPGDAAPDFDLADDADGRVRLADHRGSRVVLYAYPAALTPGCTTQACDFRDSLEALSAAGITVIGLSPDIPEKLAKFRAHRHLTFALASDPDREVLTAYGAFGEKTMYGKVVTGVIRSTFVIDAEGASSAPCTTCAPRATSPSCAGNSACSHLAPLRSLGSASRSSTASCIRPGAGPRAATMGPRGCGGTGRRAGFRFLCPRDMRVRVPSPARTRAVPRLPGATGTTTARQRRARDACAWTASPTMPHHRPRPRHPSRRAPGVARAAASTRCETSSTVSVATSITPPGARASSTVSMTAPRVWSTVSMTTPRA